MTDKILSCYLLEMFVFVSYFDCHLAKQTHDKPKCQRNFEI